MKRILIVDDSKLNLVMVTQELSGEYDVSAVTSGMEALEFLEQCKKLPDVILLDLVMPGMDGMETMRFIRRNEKWTKIPIIFMTSDSSAETEAQCLADGAEEFIVKPIVPLIMKSRISHTLELNALRNHLEMRLEEKTREVEAVTMESIMAMVHTIEAKDRYLSGHSEKVASCCVEMARCLGWKEEDINNLRYAALMHDIGKIGIPESILNKPDKLDEDEFEIVKNHTVAGSEILKNIHAIPGVREAALYHHERYDGTGYPEGLCGDNIPIQARMIAIADAYDAMTSERAYRGKFSRKGVITELQAGYGTQFDPKLLEVFLEMLEEGFVPAIEQSELMTVGEINNIIRRTMNEYISGLHMDNNKDVLTGLHNRKGIEEHINDMINSGPGGALLMMDVDNFKVINDSFGHRAGDGLLREIAKILKTKAGRQDVICRLGGDEFVVFYSGMTDKELLKNQAQSIIGDISAMMERSGYSVASVSVGIAIAPKDGKTFEELFVNADRSLYDIKINGKNSYGFYEDIQCQEKKRSTHADLENVRFILEGRMKKQIGGYNVEYNEFKQLYAYIYRMVVRSQNHVQILLFQILNAKEAPISDQVQLGIAMKTLETAVITSLRSVDVGTKYSGNQYILMLVDSDTENGRMVARRVTEQFTKLSPLENVSLLYDIQELEL